MKTNTKADLIERCARLDRQHEPMALALSDLVAGKVTWFGRGDVRLGISRPDGAHGGIVITSLYGTVSADYWEQWSRNQLEHIQACITGTDSEHNRDLLRRRAAIEGAQAYVRRMQHGFTAYPDSPEAHEESMIADEADDAMRNLPLVSIHDPRFPRMPHFGNLP